MDLVKGSMEIQADLVNTLLGGMLEQQDMAKNIAAVNIQMKLVAKQMGQAQEVVAQMTGVGGNLNTYI